MKQLPASPFSLIFRGAGVLSKAIEVEVKRLLGIWNKVLTGAVTEVDEELQDETVEGDHGASVLSLKTARALAAGWLLGRSPDRGHHRTSQAIQGMFKN